MTAAPATALTVVPPTDLAPHWQPDEIDVIKNILCPGITDADLALFAIQCRRTGLDPFSRQIYAIYRGSKEKPKLSIEASIDGFRLVAERTGNYCPGRPSEFTYGKDSRLESATAYVRKYVRGEWHEVAVTAYWSEFAQSFGQWTKMPRVMLSKCAEAQALRKAFPNDLSGLYTADEMAQAGTEVRYVDTYAESTGDIGELSRTPVEDTSEQITGQQAYQKMQTETITQGTKVEEKTPEPFDAGEFRTRLNKSVDDRRAKNEKYALAAPEAMSRPLYDQWTKHGLGGIAPMQIIEWLFDIPELGWADLDVASVDILSAWTKKQVTDGVLASRLQDMAAAATQWALDNDMDGAVAMDVVPDEPDFGEL